MTLGFMMVYRYTKFGYRKFSGCGDIVEMNIHWMNLSFDLDLDHNRAIQSFHKTIQLIIMCHQTKLIQLQKDQQFRRYIRKSSFLTRSFTVTLTLKTTNRYFWKTIWPMMMPHRTKFSSSMRFSISDDSLWINSH